MKSLVEQLGGAAFRIQTEKSILRPLGAADLSDRYLGWLNDPEVNRFSSRRVRKHSREDMASYVETANSSQNQILLGIFPKDSGEHVGNVLFDYNDRANGVATVANLLGEPSRWGGGYVVDADRAVIHLGFSDLGVRKFVLGNLAPNRASTFKSTSLGAKLEARMRQQEAFGDGYVDVLTFGLFPDEFYGRFPDMKGAA